MSKIELAWKRGGIGAIKKKSEMTATNNIFGPNIAPMANERRKWPRNI